MLQIQLIREQKDLVIQKLAVKNFDASKRVDEILNIDQERRSTQQELEALKAEANRLAKSVGDLFKSGKKAEAEELKNKSIALKETEKKLELVLSQMERRQHDLLVQLPNIPSDQVRPGKTPADNEVVEQSGNIPELPGDAKPHWELATKYDLIDFELGVKLTGAGFPVYKGHGARLQRALLNFFLDNATREGYREIQPPVLVNADSGYGTGQLPDKEGQMYHVQEDDLYLIPTAEVPITNIYRDVILKASDLPIRNCGYTPCFRREAGSYGKDVRGLNRLHQFDKVEIVQIAHPSESYTILEEMRNYVTGLLKQLELPFRVLRLCGGDMSFASAQTYDMEVYSAAQKKWLEVSSVSNFETFQSHRMKLRFKDEQGKTQPAHTLNGSALAFPRIVAALLENNQSENGIRIPKALVPYTGFDRIQ
ncbi:MAG: serine--tRNA ligase [Bacteroidia bacterium]|nr:serine--tRNA ligase [Bacteroidia bacterium]